MKTKVEDFAGKKYEIKFKKPMILLTLYFVVGILTGIYCILFENVRGYTYLWSLVMFLVGGIGQGPAAHRYFCHHCFKAKRVIKYFFIFCEQMSDFNSIQTWVRIHRTHHKFYDTDRDPTNINRGFIYGAVGWYLFERTPECDVELERIFMDDLKADRDLNIQHKYFPIFFVLITNALPTIIPCLLWKETLLVGFGMNMFRFGINLSHKVMANTSLHSAGKRPYDRTHTATDSDFLNFLTLGEGYHNFHHAFPFDYRGNERFSLAHIGSLATLLIEILSFLGLAYDKKVASPQMIARRVTRTGDGSHPLAKQYYEQTMMSNNNNLDDHAKC